MISWSKLDKCKQFSLAVGLRKMADVIWHQHVRFVFGICTEPFAMWTDPLAIWTDSLANWTDPLAAWTDSFTIWADPFAIWTDSSPTYYVFTCLCVYFFCMCLDRVGFPDLDPTHIYVECVMPKCYHVVHNDYANIFEGCIAQTDVS